VCGTDLHQRPGEPPPQGGFGHEAAGTVVETGSCVSTPAVGQTVALDSSTPCGRCEACRNARQELCTDVKSFFRIKSFGFAEEMIGPAVCAIPYQGLTPEVACLQEPLGVAIDMVRVADIQPGCNVLLMGPGPIGLMALALVRRAGARRIYVYGHRRRTARARLAEQFGADAFIDVESKALHEQAFDSPIDRILVTSPPGTLEPAFRVASKGAVIAFIGIAYGEAACCRFNANDFHFKKLQLRASFASPALFGPLALQYLREGVVDGEAVISHRFPLEEIEEALRTAREDPEAVKVVVTP
jgi:L-iditol 2-dehydrogenase